MRLGNEEVEEVHWTDILVGMEVTGFDWHRFNNVNRWGVVDEVDIDDNTLWLRMEGNIYPVDYSLYYDEDRHEDCDEDDFRWYLKGKIEVLKSGFSKWLTKDG